MSLFFMIPAAILWLIWIFVSPFLPGWLDYGLFGASCVATAAGGAIAMFASGWKL